MITTKKASFNGIEFDVIASAVSGGHRQSIHEFNNNKSSVRQHGVKTKTYSLTAIFVGSDSLVRVNKLIKELDNLGAGILMHPHLGELNVALESHKTSIDTRKSQVNVTLNFIQQDEVNLLTEDFYSLLLDKISTTKTNIVINTAKLITSSDNTQQAILDIANSYKQSNLNESNLSSTLATLLNTKAPNISSSYAITTAFNSQHKVIDLTNSKMGRHYLTTKDFLTDSNLIIDAFEKKEITNSAIANDFYDLKFTLAKYLLDVNKNLPKLKQHTFNTELPSYALKQRLGSSTDDFNHNMHPLFSDPKVNYVS